MSDIGLPVGISLQVRIPARARKIVVFNNYRNLAVKFRSHSYKYLTSYIVRGITSICLCHKNWDLIVQNDDMVSIELVHFSVKHRCYLQELTVGNTNKDILFLYVEHTRSPQTLSALCVMQLRARNYVPCGYEAIMKIGKPVPKPIHSLLCMHAFILLPCFDIDDETIGRTCENIKHWRCWYTKVHKSVHPCNKFSPLQHIGNFMRIIFVAADQGV